MSERGWWKWWVVAFFALGLFTLSFGGVAFMMSPWMGYGGWNMMGYGGWGMMRYGTTSGVAPAVGYGMTFGLVLVALFRLFLLLSIGIGLIFFVRWLTLGGRMRYDRAVEIAKERYAHGEITRKEFEEIRKTVQES